MSQQINLYNDTVQMYVELYKKFITFIQF